MYLIERAKPAPASHFPDVAQRGKLGLDKASASHKIRVTAVFMEPICKHTRTEVIARRDGVEYVQCLDCRQIFEAEDLESVPVYDDEDQSA